MVVRALKKCGIPEAIDGSEDEEININNTEDNNVGSSDEDPFESSNQHRESDDDMYTTDNEPVFSVTVPSDNEASEREN